MIHLNVLCPGKVSHLLTNLNTWTLETQFILKAMNVPRLCPHPLKGTHLFSSGVTNVPFVVKTKNTLTGFGPEMLKVLADQIGFKLTFFLPEFESDHPSYQKGIYQGIIEVIEVKT